MVMTGRSPTVMKNGVKLMATILLSDICGAGQWMKAPLSDDSRARQATGSRT